MDGFSNIFATPQDMIAANGQAEADEIKNLQTKVEEGLEENRNLKNSVNQQAEENKALQGKVDQSLEENKVLKGKVDKSLEENKALQDKVGKYEGVLNRFNKTVDSLDKKISEIHIPEPNITVDTSEYSSKLNGVEGKLQDHIHKENVRVYRNVQASVTDELNKQTESLTSIINNLSEKIDRLEMKIDEIQSADSASAQERDGQVNEKFAKLDEKLDKLNETAANNLEKTLAAGKGRAILPLQIIVLIAVLADLVVNICRILGIM